MSKETIKLNNEILILKSIIKDYNNEFKEIFALFNKEFYFNEIKDLKKMIKELLEKGKKN